MDSARDAAGGSADAVAQALVDEAIRKAAIAWVAVDDRPARAVWCMPHSGSLWLVTGSGEQQCPGLAEAAGTADRVRVTLRGEHRGRVVTWPAQVHRLEPSDTQWEEIAPQLAAKRLNASADAATVTARWAAECAVWCLSPAGAPTEAGPTLPDASSAAPPRTARAATPGRARGSRRGPRGRRSR